MFCFKVKWSILSVFQGGGLLGSRSHPPSPPLKYKLIYIRSQRNNGNRTSEDALTFTFCFGLHLIVEGKLDVGRCEDLSFWSSPIFSMETCEQEIAAPPFQISGHAPGISFTVQR